MEKKDPDHRITSFIPGGLLIIALMIGLVSCSKWIDEEINVDPNQPGDVTMDALLSFIEADVAFKMAGSAELIGTQAIWLQQLDGIDRQALATSNYSFDPYLFIWIWGDAYAEILMDAKTLTAKARAAGSPHFEGISNILAAITLGQLTDSWGDIPWSEALQGNEMTQPAYDSQESVYESIHQLLDDAIDSLSASPDNNIINGDYFYNGDWTKWLRAAHALKARYYLHLTKRWGNQAYEKALEEIPLAFSGNDDDLQFNYGTGETESNPFYQFMQEKDNVRMGAYLIDLLKMNDDPRLVMYALPDASGNYSGSAPGQTDVNASRPGLAFTAPDAPTYIITYAEMLFTKAEALLKTGTADAEVRSVLLEAVTGSLKKFEVTDQDWLAAYGQKLGQLEGEELFAEIMVQKYIASFYQPEAYHSWRRTGYPVIPPNPSGQISVIPRRFLYPISEQVYNYNTPKGKNLTDPVWWDE